MNAIDEIGLRKQSIFDLRNLARDIGVASPTLFKKEELIAKIMRIVNGEDKFELPKGRQGRPPKNGNILNSDASIKFPGYVIENSADSGIECSRPNFMLAEAAFNYGNPTKVERGVGCLKILPNSQGFVFNNNNYGESNAIYVSPMFIQQNNLREGDRFEYEFKQSQSGKIVSKFVKGFFGKKRSNFDELNVLGSSHNQLEISNVGNFCEGSRNVLLVKDVCTCNQILKKVRANVTKDCKIVSLRLDSLPEDASEIEDDFFVNVGEKSEKALFFCSLVSSRVKRLVEEGHKVVLVIDELMKITKHQNYFRGNNIYDVKQNSFVACEALVKLASCYGNGGSITLLAFCKHNPTNSCQQILLDELDNMKCKTNII